MVSQVEIGSISATRWDSAHAAFSWLASLKASEGAPTKRSRLTLNRGCRTWQRAFRLWSAARFGRESSSAELRQLRKRYPPLNDGSARATVKCQSQAVESSVPRTISVNSE